MNLLTTRQADLIVASVRKVLTTGNIEHLSNSAYKFLYLSSGFIAHYNLGGFRVHYANTEDLSRAIAENLPMNQWNNFTPRDKDFAYYMQKKEIYNRLVQFCPSQQVSSAFATNLLRILRR